MARLGVREINLATDAPLDELSKIFPSLLAGQDEPDSPGMLAMLR